MEAESSIATATATSLQMVDYSDKSFAVIGNTKPFSSQMKELGGRFNRYLKVNNEQVPGWIFSKTRQEEVAAFLLDPSKSSSSSTNTHSSLPSSISSSTSSSTNSNNGLPVVQPPRGTGQNYQYIKFKIYKPRVGMKVTLKTEGEATMHGEVISVETSDGDVDGVYMSFGEQTTYACICRQKWQVFGYNKNHSLFFTE